MGDLISICKATTNEDSRNFALTSFGYIGTPAAAAVPVLAAAVADTNRVIRAAGLYSLGCIHAHPDLVIPLLASTITNGAEDFLLREMAASALDGFGAEAKSNSSILVTLLQEPAVLDPQHVLNLERTRLLKQHIKSALREIDSEAAAKVIEDGNPEGK